MTMDYNEYFASYLAYVEGLSVGEALQRNQLSFLRLMENISEEKSMFQYATGKWTIKELVSHVIDSERVFAYRAMRFARNDETELSGFDEKHYATNSGANERSIKEILTEFDANRNASIALFESFTPEMLLRKGIANGMKMAVNMLGLLIAGHCEHHAKIAKERYL